VIGVVYPVAAIVLCTLAGAVYQSLTEEREKRRIRNAFRQYLNPEVTDMLAEDPVDSDSAASDARITVLFSDIRGFTTISEKLPPETLAELLNQYPRRDDRHRVPGMEPQG